MSRDVIGDLLDASYMGVPFYVERDGVKGGRRLAVHEFYGADQPYVEDLGGAAVHYDVTCYLVGDTYDSDAASLQSVFGTQGPALLVLPVDGPVLARLETFDRARALDRSGYIAFQAHFIQEGGGLALLSTPYLAQLVYSAVSDLANVSGQALVALAIIGQPAWIVADAASQLSDLVAQFDTIRVETPVDVSKSGLLATRFAATYQALPALVDPVAGLDASVAPTLVDLAVALADALPPSAAVAAFATAFDAIVDPPSLDPTRSVNAQVAAANARVVTHLSRLAMLAAYVEGLIGVTYESRPDAITARADCVERFAVALEAAGGADHVDLYVALQNLRSRAVDFFGTAIIDLRPIVTVTAAQMMPSLWWAWRLYQDPARATDLVARNAVKHPSYMPEQFEALAPDAATLLPVAA